MAAARAAAAAVEGQDPAAVVRSPREAQAPAAAPDRRVVVSGAEVLLCRCLDQLSDARAPFHTARGPQRLSRSQQDSRLQVDRLAVPPGTRSLEQGACHAHWYQGWRLTRFHRSYGSGYPGVSGLGVGGRGFPFVFWPVVWGGGLGYGAAYLHANHEVSGDDGRRRFLITYTFSVSMASRTTRRGQEAR